MEDEHNNKIITLQTFNLLSSLLSILNTNDELDTDFVIAKYFLNNLNHLKDISIYKVADECFVSRSSVQRFIKNKLFHNIAFGTAITANRHFFFTVK